jgi:hypothetical protein
MSSEQLAAAMAAIVAEVPATWSVKIGEDLWRFGHERDKIQTHYAISVLVEWAYPACPIHQVYGASLDALVLEMLQWCNPTKFPKSDPNEDQLARAGAKEGAKA